MRKPRHIESLEYGPGKELKTTDPKLIEVFREVRTIYAPAHFPVVIQGETGTGKEGIARALHWHSPRRNKPFVAVNCGAIPEGIVDSEFFGHERGAFSGAINARKGHFEVANGGTLFLDEISEMPLGLQARLLRVLQEGEIVRVGSSRPLPVDVRVVAATNRDLKTFVEDGKFRADLYYRIAAAVVRLSPLRERPSDILMLAKVFIERHCVGQESTIRLQPLVASILRTSLWPGNARELQGVVTVACTRVLAEGRASLGLGDLPPRLISGRQSVEQSTSLNDRITAFLKDNPNESLMDAAAFFGVAYHRVRRVVVRRVR